MLFNSIDYVFFLPLLIIGYYLLPQKYRWALLLAGSYYFYASWKLEYIILIIFSTLIDFFCGRMMEKYSAKIKRRPFLILSIVSNLGMLFLFKYWNFFSETTNEILICLSVNAEIPLLELLLPVGISFYTFQTLSYSIDVYQGKLKAENHLGYFALYVSFFPQLVAGPIERYSRLTPQLKSIKKLQYDSIKNGLRLILFGLFVKMVIADNLGPLVDSVYEAPELYNQLSIGLAMVFYSFQIYGDFFGYSLVAIGSAKLMGIDLMDNFKTPYLSKNIAEFWQRWHISLSTWFRDYLYFPLGGNRVKKARWFLNILVVFIVSGLWHGANLTFLFWGLIFGFFYILENLLSSKKKLNRQDSKMGASILYYLKTFLIVTFAWTFFRSASIAEAFEIFQCLFFGSPGNESMNLSITIIILLSTFFILDILLYNNRYDKWVDTKSVVVRWGTYFLLIFSLICLSGVEDVPFIYFQF